MSDRFAAFLFASRWASAILALMYHVRFLLFVGYGDVEAKTGFSRLFYFLTGLGHESFAVFFVVDGIAAGLLLRHRGRAAKGRSPVARRLGALYGILLPGLLLGAALDAAGVRFFNGAGVYTAFPAFSSVTLTNASLLGNLLMLQPFVVPTFGSNGMLYLLSYLFWSFVLLFFLARGGGLDALRRRPLRAVLLALLVVVVMPYPFLLWAAIWLAGVAVVLLGEAHAARPPLALACAGFATTLVLSRLAGAGTDLPAPLGEGIVRAGYLLVGVGFAAVARALYPDGATVRRTGERAGQPASFTFFFHFPVIMLLAAAGSALLHAPLMRQPAADVYWAFAGLVGACLLAIGLAARAVGAAVAALASGRTRPDRSNRL